MHSLSATTRRWSPASAGNEHPLLHSSPLKVLCVSPRFVPANAADSHRVRLILPHLLAQGCDVEVLAVQPDDVAAPQDQELLAWLPSSLAVHHVRARALSFWGLRGLAQRSFLPLYRRGCELLASGRFDLVFFSTTEFLLHGLGPLWRTRFGIPFCMDLQDPWVNDYYRDNPQVVPPGGRLKHGIADRLHRLVERQVVPRCSGFLSVSPAYLPMLQRRHGGLITAQPRLVAGFPGEPGELSGLDPAIPLQSKSGGVWRYIGRGGPDMVRAATAFFVAWRQAIDEGLLAASQVSFEALGTSYATGAAASKTLEPLARQAGLTGRVRENPERLPYVAALRTLQASDALIVFGSDDPAYTASKIYPYLLSGKPLLCIFHQSSSVVSLMQSVGGGVCVQFDAQTSVEALAAAIRRAWFEPRQYETPLPLDLAAFEPHTARAQAAALAKWFEQVVAYGG